jgi:tetratricopeptide (TPR) repeat protein
LYTAHTPEREQAAASIRGLVEEALDGGLTKPARLGFQMLSYLRWEGGSMIAAHDNIMRAERISRSGDPRERTVALSQAAKCLVLLERDLTLAESFLLEADALAVRSGTSPSSMRFAEGMMFEHRGKLEEAARSFREARQLGQEQGDRLGEFAALEHLTMLELDRGNREEARALTDDLRRVGDRLREGAEGACGRALHALARLHVGESASDALESAIGELRTADSKYRLAWVLSRLARLRVEQGDISNARASATAALDLARDIGRASEIALAASLLLRIAVIEEDGDALTTVRAELTKLGDAEVSAHARAAIEDAIAHGS